MTQLLSRNEISFVGMNKKYIFFKLKNGNAKMSENDICTVIF